MDLQRAEQALRAAHAAGDVDAARRIAAGILERRAGPAPEPDRSAMSVYELNRRGPDAPPRPPEVIPGQRTAADVGAGLDPETRQRFLDEGQDVAVELGIQAAAPGIGGAIAKPLGSLGRFLARGARGKAEVARELAAAGGSVKGKGSLLGDISKELGIAAGFGAVVDMGPGFIPGGQDVSEPLQDFAAFLATMSRLRPASRNLLLAHPQFARWAQSSARGGIGAAVGAMTGAAATFGPELKAAFGEFMSEAESEAPGPQAGASDVSGPLPPRVPRDRLEEQRELARRLMAG